MGEVIYTNSNGYKEVRWVPAHAVPSQYQWGVLLGPPDLSGLAVSERQRREINNKLAEAYIYDLHTLVGRRGELVKILESVGIKQLSEVRNAIISYYQQDMYPELFGGS